MDRQRAANKIQYIQDKVQYLYRHFDDDSLAFKAGYLAWLALRLFWRAVKVGDDGGKLVEVENALVQVKQHLEVS